MKKKLLTLLMLLPFLSIIASVEHVTSNLLSHQWSGAEYTVQAITYDSGIEYGYGAENSPHYNKIVGVPNADSFGREWFDLDFSCSWKEITAPLNNWCVWPNYGDIYARRTFYYEGELPAELYLACGHDDAPCEYYLNGTLIWSMTDGWYEQEIYKFTESQKTLLRPGELNVIAFHVHQNWGLMYADCGLYTSLPNMNTENIEIASAEDLANFSSRVNAGETSLCAVLTANINLNGVEWTPIGNASTIYTGSFDGQGHTITNFSLTTSSDHSGLFGQVANGAVIKNFTIDGDIDSKHQYVGVIGSTGSGIVNISNIHSKLNITCTRSRHGGILGHNISAGTVNIDRCIYSGTLNPGTNVGNFGGIVGLALNDESAIINITNCLFDGTIENGTTDGDCGGIVGYCNKGKVTIMNCLSIGTVHSANPGQFFGTLKSINTFYAKKNYYLGGSTKGKGTGAENGITPKQVNNTQLTSGDVCYMLNGDQTEINWYQTLGEDDYPLLDNSHSIVYQNGHLHCDGTMYEDGATGYSNDNYSTITKDEHIFVDGFCSYCGIPDENHTPNVLTIIVNSDTQPMYAGGFITNYFKKNITKKGIIVSKSAEDMVISEDTQFVIYPIDYPNIAPIDIPKDIRFIDCTTTNEEQFSCALKFLMGNTDYYVRAFVIDNNNNVNYGGIENVHTQNYNRYNGNAGYGNVWYAFQYTLFDLVTDEIIDPNDGFYYTTNENPTTVNYQVGTDYNTCYKIATKWNYELWYYHSWWCDYSKIVRTPVMKYKNGKLEITKAEADADKDITIYYSINGDGTRPENFTQIYSEPLTVENNSIVYCYAKSSDGYISYTNRYVVSSFGITSTLTYIVDGEVYKTYEVEYNTPITPEPAPIKEGYTFCGWSEIPEMMPDHDVTVTGSFTINSEDAVVNIGSTGYATFCSPYALDFSKVSDVRAYIASGFNPSTGKLVLTRVDEVPAGEGLYLVGNPGTHNVPFTETNMLYSNFLKGVTTATTIYPTEGSYTNFILANGSHGIGFYTLSNSGQLAAGKAYLQLPTSSVSHVKAISVVFEDDDATAIQDIEGCIKAESIYNLQGQRVNSPKRGLYIINGQKVLIK